MADPLEVRPTALFVVRLWREEVMAGHEEWRGEVKNLSNGEIRHFRDWSTLAQLILSMIGQEDVAQAPGGDPGP